MKAVTDTKYYDDIAYTIGIYGTGDKLKPSQMAMEINTIVCEREDYGKAQGRQAAYNEFWGKIQNNGGRRNYRRMFGNREAWDDDSFKPVYDMVASTMQECFAVNSTLTSIKYKANGEILTIDGSSISSSTGFNNAFDQMTNLQEIGLIISSANAPWLEAFRNDTNLVEVSFGGTIGKAFDIHYSTKLSSNSLLSILTACNKEGALVTITLPANCIDGKTNTETYIANDTELNTALTNARWNGYTVVFN